MHTPKFAICLALLFALAHATSIPKEQCWTETKKCRYVAVASGYECKDYYADKYARCHPKMKYKKKCDKVVYSPKAPKKPADYIIWEQSKSTLVDYDRNYGPHVDGYPHTEHSDYYYAKKLPSKPHGVTEDAVPSPATGVAPGEPDYVVPPKTGTQKPAYTVAPTPMPSSSSPTYTASPKATQAPGYTAPSYAPAPAPATNGTAHASPVYTQPPHASAPAPATSGAQSPKY